MPDPGHAPAVIDRGSTTLTTVLLTPVFIVVALMAFQAALWSHARTEARVVARNSAALVARSHVYTMMGNVMLAVPRGVTGYSLRPVLSGGAGLMHVSISDIAGIAAIDANMFGVNIGGGALGPISSVLDVRFDLRWFKSVTSGGERPLRPGPALAFFFMHSPRGSRIYTLTETPPT